jgi:acylaminoacyl-peptidase
MINWINGHTDRFACLVSHDGLFNTLGGYYTTEELWFPESEFLGPPDASSSFREYDKWNPMNYADKMKTPTLVIHSERDYRLTMNEGIGMFTALQRHGVTSRLLYFPDENHWVLKPWNWLQWQREVTLWLDTHSKDQNERV